MNKRGFTLIELLAVLVLISVITLIAIPSIRYAAKKIDQSNYEAKVEMIERASEDFAMDMKEFILYHYTSEQGERIIPYEIYLVPVEDIIAAGYLDYDKGKTPEGIYDPVSNKNMATGTVNIYYDNNQAYAVLVWSRN